MATSKPRRILGLTATMLLAAAAVPLILAEGSTRARAASGGALLGPDRTLASFSWLVPVPAPAAWHHVTTATSDATLFYPPGWRAIPGDKGTVTEALRDSAGRYAGYLNLTPRQGGEQLRIWPAFRTSHNREEGDRDIRQLSAAHGLRFRDAYGSCVIDDYLSKVGSNPYREIACLVSGHHNTDVFIGAALRRDWPSLSLTVERAASSLLQR
jgi:hypothetical protein